MKWQKLKIWVKTWLKRILNWRFLVCFLIAWMITNGWSYISFAISSIFDISWLKVVATTYISLLWLPFTPEKILTFIIALFIMKKIFPQDQKSIQELENMINKEKRKNKKIKIKCSCFISFSNTYPKITSNVTCWYKRFIIN